MNINKSTRHQKIIGNLGEYIICNWLSRSGFEVTLADHTGLDIIAYYNNAEKKYRIGITVKSRTRHEGTENSSVYIFSNKSNDRDKLRAACLAFACEPWIAVYIETSDDADIYITSLENYDKYYRKPGRVRDEWYMKKAYKAKYANDDKVNHIHIDFKAERWEWCWAL